MPEKNLISEEFEGKNFRENSATPKAQQSWYLTFPCEAFTVKDFFLILKVKERKFIHKLYVKEPGLFQSI